MKRLHSPIMEELEPPTSPRKKLKLQELSFGATMADSANLTESLPQVPEVMTAIPEPATTGNQLSEQSTFDSISSKDSTTLNSLKAAPISETSFAMPGFTAEDHSKAVGAFRSIQAANASEAQPAVTDVIDLPDDGSSKEAACGITEFVRPNLISFSGILKKRYVFLIITLNNQVNMGRYTDFLVNEILPSGEVVHLDNLKAPPKPPRNIRPPKNASEVSSAFGTENTPKAPAAVIQQATTEHEQSGSAPTTTSSDEKHPLQKPDTSNPAHATPKLKENSSTTEAPQAVPQSMQGFDKYELAPTPPVDDQEKISPHKRVPPPVPSMPSSMQDLDDAKPETKQEKAPRRKEKVHIRQTSQGWVEFDKEKEDETKKRKAEEDAAAGVKPEDATKMEEIRPEEATDVPGFNQLNSEQVPKTSNEASWQAFASSAPSGFQVSSQVIQRDCLTDLDTASARGQGYSAILLQLRCRGRDNCSVRPHCQFATPQSKGLWHGHLRSHRSPETNHYTSRHQKNVQLSSGNNDR